MQHFLNFTHNLNHHNFHPSLFQHQNNHRLQSQSIRQHTIRTQPASPQSSKTKIKMISPSRNVSPSLNNSQNSNKIQPTQILIQRLTAPNSFNFDHNKKQHIALGGRKTERSPIKITYQNSVPRQLSPNHMEAIKTSRSPLNYHQIPQNKVFTQIYTLSPRHHFLPQQVQNVRPVSPPHRSPVNITFQHQNIRRPFNTQDMHKVNLQPHHESLKFKNHHRTSSQFLHKGPIEYRLIEKIPPKQIIIVKKKPSILNNNPSNDLQINEPNQIVILKNSYENEMKQIKILQQEIAQNNQEIKQLLKSSTISKNLKSKQVIFQQQQKQKSQNTSKSLAKFKSHETFINQLNLTVSKKAQSKADIPQSSQIQSSCEKQTQRQRQKQQKLQLIKNNECEVKMVFKVQKPEFEIIPQQSMIQQKIDHNFEAKLNNKSWNTQNLITQQIAEYINGSIEDQNINIINQMISHSQQKLSNKNILQSKRQNLSNKQKSTKTIKQQNNQIQKVVQILSNKSTKKQNQKQPFQSNKSIKKQNQKQPFQSNKSIKSSTKDINQNQIIKIIQNLQKQQKKQSYKTIDLKIPSHVSIQRQSNKHLVQQNSVKKSQKTLTKISKQQIKQVFINQELNQSKPSIEIENKQQPQQISFSSKNSIPQNLNFQKSVLSQKQNVIDISHMTQKIHNAFKKNTQYKKQSNKNITNQLIQQKNAQNKKQNTKYRFSENQIQNDKVCNLVQHKFQTYTMPNFYSSNVSSLQSPYKILNQSKNKAQTTIDRANLKRINNRVYL